MQIVSIARRIFIGVTAGCLSLPGLLTLFMGEGSGLGGVTKHGRAVSLHLESFLNGSFQKQFETRFARSLLIFGSLVRFDNQVSLSLFKQVSSNPKSRVVLGNSGHLIERSYLSAFNRQGVPKRSKLQTAVKQLVRLNKLLTERQKTFLLIISTNKPSYYPELVPSWYTVKRAQSRASGYETFVELLKATNVSFIDSRPFLKGVEAEFNTPIFQPTGTHWNELGACAITSAIASHVKSHSHTGIGTLQCTIDGLRKVPTDQDLDLLKITNLLFPKALIRPSPRVVAHVLPSGTTDAKPRLLMIGTSFCWELLKIMNRNPLFSVREFLYYFQRQLVAPGGVQRPIKKDSFDIAAAIERSDVIVIEVNEAYVHRVGYGFMERAISALENSGPTTRNG